MPTNPHHDVLNRELAILNAKEDIDFVSPLLQEAVNLATHMLVLCANSKQSGDENEDLAVLSCYCHILEMTDGIEVLLSHSCVVPAIPLLRSSFEALLSIEYILEDENLYVNRSLAWLYEYTKKRQTSYKRLDPSTDQGKQAIRSFEQDKWLQNYKIASDISKVKKAIQNLDNLLDRPQFKIVKDEWAKFEKPCWYTLFNSGKKLTKLEQLAHHLNRDGQYQILYRYWSSVIHAQDFSRFIVGSEGGNGQIGGLRRSDELMTTARLALIIMIDSTRLMLLKFTPEEEDNFKKWYKAEIKQSKVFG